jgi:hypothetical protein
MVARAVFEKTLNDTRIQSLRRTDAVDYLSAVNGIFRAETSDDTSTHSSRYQGVIGDLSMVNRAVFRRLDDISTCGSE